MSNADEVRFEGLSANGECQPFLDPNAQPSAERSVAIQMSPVESAHAQTALSLSPRATRIFEILDGAKKNFEEKELEVKEILNDPACTKEETQQVLLEVNGQKKTILHIAAKIPNRQAARRMTEVILHKYDKLYDTPVKFVDLQDENGNTALHLAIEAGREKLAQIILKCKPDLALRNKHEKGYTCLELIQSRMPKLLQFQYDEGVRWVDDEQEQILLNFNKITESHFDFSSDTAEELDKRLESNNFSGVLKGRSENFDVILDHPLVQVFLCLKYRRAYPFIIMSMLIHVAWHVIYAYFIFQIYYTSCPWKPEVRGNTNGDASENVTTVATGDTTIECNRSNIDALVLVLGVMCWILGGLFLFKEAFEILAAPSKVRYFTELENIGQLFVCGSVVFTSIPVYQYLSGSTLVTIHPWQYKVSAVTLFVVWTLVLGQICKIQELRIYIEIFLKVIKSFALFICTFASLLFAFAFALCILMPEGKAFTSPWLAVPKVLVMMTGELNYDEVFYSDAASAISPDHYLTMQVLFSLFTVLMSMVLLNMLIGLAVNDTQELRQQSHIAALYSMLQEIFLLESFAFRLHKGLRMPWLFKRLSINLDTQRHLNDPLTRCLFTKKMPVNEKDTASITGSRVSLSSNTKIKVDAGLFYKYDTGRRSENYPFSDEVMAKLVEIADGKCTREYKEH